MMRPCIAGMLLLAMATLSAAAQDEEAAAPVETQPEVVATPLDAPAQNENTAPLVESGPDDLEAMPDEARETDAPDSPATPEGEMLPPPASVPEVAVETLGAPVAMPDPEDASGMLTTLIEGDDAAFARTWRAWPLLGSAALRPVATALAADSGARWPLLLQLLDRAVLGNATDAETRDALATELLAIATEYAPEEVENNAVFEQFLPGFFGILDAWARYAGALPKPAQTGARTLAVQRELIRRAGRIASEEYVPALRVYLAHEGLGDAALGALAMIPGEAAASAVLEGMTERGGAANLARANSLQYRHPDDAARLYRHLLAATEDPAVAAASMTALGRLGIVPRDTKPWGDGAKALSAELRETAGLLAAQTKLAAGEADAAASLFFKQMDDYTHQYQIRAALIGLREAGSPKLQNVALAHAGAQDLRETVIDVLARDTIPGTEAGLRKAWKHGSPAMRAVLIEVFARRGVADLDALITEAGVDDNLELRFRAAQKEGITLGADALLDLARNGGAAVRNDALRAFMDRAFAEAIEGNLTLASEQFRIVLDGPFPEHAQREALEGLGMTGDPADFERIRSFLYRPAHHNAAAAALIQLAAQNPDPDAAIADIQAIIQAVDSSEVLALAAGMLESLGADSEPMVLEQGFVTHWRVLGPFTLDTLKAHPEIFGRIIRRRLTENVHIEDTQFVWRDAAATGVPARVDLEALFEDTEGDAAFALTRLPVATWTPVIVNLYQQGGARLWLNGKAVDAVPANTDGPQKIELVLTPGVNRLMVQLLRGTPAWAYGVQLTDRRYTPLDLTAQELPEDDAAGVGLSLDAVDRTITEETP